MNKRAEYNFTINYTDGGVWSRIHSCINPGFFAHWLSNNIEHYNREVESVTYKFIQHI